MADSKKKSGARRASSKPESEQASEQASAPASKPESKPESKTDATPARFEIVHLWQIQAVRDLLFVAAFIAIIWLGYAMSAVTVPLLVALLLAYLFEPVIQQLTRHRKINRPIAVAGLLCTVGLVVVIFLAVSIPLIAGQTIQFINDLRSGQIRAQIAGLIEHTPEVLREEVDDILDIFPAVPEGGAATSNDEPWLTETGLAFQDTQATGEDAGQTPEESDQAETEAETEGEGEGEEQQAEEALTTERVREIIDEELYKRGIGPGGEEAPPLLGFAGAGVRTLWSFISASFYIALLCFLIPFYFYFFSVFWPRVVAWGRRLVPAKHKERTFELIGKMDEVVSGFVRGRIIICMIVSVLLAIGWFIVGVPYAIVLGVITGLLFLVPYLGGLGFIIALILNVIEAADDPVRGDLWLIWAALWPTVVFMILQFIESYFLTPKIAGKATNLDPVTIIVVVLAGGSILGVYGMLLAIPIAACGKIIFTEVLFPTIDAWLKGERSDPLPIEQREE